MRHETAKTTATAAAGGVRWRRRLGRAGLAGGVALLLASAGSTPALATPVATPPTVTTCSVADLASAMAAAATYPRPVTLTLPPGCTFDVTGPGYTAGANGPDAFAPVGTDETLTIVGQGDTISTAPGVASRLFEVDAGGALTLENLTLGGGHDTSGKGGGAVWNAGTFTATSTTFANDTTTGSGGAIDSGDGAAGAVTTQLTNDTFENDSAQVHGGAVDSADHGGTGTATVVDSTFTGNTVTSSGDTSANGGAIDNGDDGGNGALTVTGSLFDANTADGGPSTADGGAIDSATRGNGTLTVTTSTFEANRATISGDAWAQGGALAVADGEGSGTLALVDSTFFANSAVTTGAAVADFGSGSLLASTFDANTSHGGTLLLGDALMAADLVASPSPACDTSLGSPADGGYNLVSDGTCALSLPTSGVVPTLASDLEPLGNNTGPTPTMALAPSPDPAVGAIPNGTLTPVGSTDYPNLCGRTDQTGYTSPAGAACAVGAFEPRAAASPVPPGSGGLPVPVVVPAPVPAPAPAPAVLPALSVVAPTATIPYGSRLPALAPAYRGFVDGDTAASLATPATCTTTATASSPPGTYPVTCSGAVDARYTIGYTAGRITVTPAPLTVTAPSLRVSYGTPLVGTSPAPSGGPETPSARAPRAAAVPARLVPTYRGFVDGDTAASLATPATCTTTATASSPPGTYPVTCSGAVDASYTIGYTAGTLRITPRRLVVKAPSRRVVYGAPLPTPARLSPAYAGFVRNQGPSSLTRRPTCAARARSRSRVGTYRIACSGALDRDYVVRYVPGALTIAPAPLTVAAPSLRLPFGTAPPARLVPTYRGFVDGDTAASLATPATCTTTATASSPPGTYPVTCSGAVDASYTIGYTAGRITVAALAVPRSVPAGSAGLAAALPASVVDAGAIPTVRAPRPSRPARSPGLVPTHLSIPSIEVSAPVVPVGDPGGVLAPPSDLATVGWWTGSPRPGSPAGGTTVLVGHVDGRNGAGVPVEGALFSLDRVPVGSRVEVATAGGGTVAYVVAARRLYEKDGLPLRAIVTATGRPRLVVVTCGGPFDQTTGQYADNVVVYLTPAGGPATRA